MDDVWYPLAEMDIGHTPVDAVDFWLTTGVKYGPKSKEVREWMLDPDNYELQHYKRNRSAGARSKSRYES